MYRDLAAATSCSLAAVLCLVTQRSSPQTAAHIRTTFLSHCFCGLMKGPIMYQQIENDVSVRAKKDNGTSGRSFNLATDFLSLFFYGGQNRSLPRSRSLSRHATLLPTNGCSHSNNIPFPLFLRSNEGANHVSAN